MSSTSPSPSSSAGPVVGTRSERTDTFTEGPLHRLAALLDYPVSPWPAGVLPPLAHWLYFLPDERQSVLGPDGHPAIGLVAPPADGPRRMWAGSRVEFRAPVPLGSDGTRTSVVTRVEAKTGRTGPLNFATVRHTITAAGVVAVVEEQDLVFRGVSPAPPPVPRPAPLQSEASRRMTLDASALFRFSALTFNAHRIHYDVDYARDVEGYPGLVVHGPLQAILLLDHLSRERPGLDIATFSFRGRAPMFTHETIQLNLAETDGGFALWTSGADGGERMSAAVTLR